MTHTTAATRRHTVHRDIPQREACQRLRELGYSDAVTDFQIAYAKAYGTYRAASGRFVLDRRPNGRYDLSTSQPARQSA